MKNLRHGMILLLAAMLLAGAPACRGKSEQDRILDLVKEIEKRTEKRDLTGLLACLAEDYSDAESRDKSATREMVGDYFRQFRGIVVHFLSTKIREIKEGEAAVESEVAVSSGAAEMLRRLFSSWGECYRFSLQLVKAGDRWLIRTAEWQNVPREGLFPESLEILKNLFPD